jgi:ABC-2 type transport system permease protein
MWRQIARKDVRDSIRERQLYLAGALFAVVGLITGWMYGDGVRYATQPALEFLGLLAGVSVFLAPITGLMLAQGRIVDKRSRGELVVLLGMPFSRRDVVVGSLAGRIAVTAAVVTTLYALATGVAAVMLAPIPLARLLAAVAVFVPFAGIFVSIGVGISAASASTTRAAVLAVGVYLLFVFRLHDVLWRLLVNGVYGARYAPPEMLPIVAQFGPFAALRNVVAGVYPELTGAFAFFGGPPPTDVTALAQPIVGVVVLGFWAVGPLYLGLQRFEGADL